MEADLTSGHQVKRLAVELRARNRATVERCQDRVGRLCEQRLATLLEDACNRIAPANRITRFERLEIDLGVITGARFDEEFVDRMAAQFEAELTDRLQAGTTEFEDESMMEDESLAEERPRGDTAEALFHFLESGTLPWWIKDRSAGVVERLYRQLLESEPTTALRILTSAEPEPLRWRRWVFELSDRALAGAIAAALQPGAPESVDSERFILQWMEITVAAVASLPDPVSEARPIAWRAALQAAAAPGQWEWSRALIDQLAALTERSLRETRDTLFRSWRVYERSGVAIDASVRAAVAENLEESSKDSSLAVSIADPGHAAASRSQPPNQTDSERMTRGGERETDRRHSDPPSRVTDFSRSDNLLLENAGLVLLWPFLPRFFDNLDLLEETGFKDRPAAERAALILQHLNDGEVKSSEIQLPLNKVLCGLPLTEPLPLELELSEDEVETCAGFLDAVIERGEIWSRLGVTEFQEAWLRRPGALDTRSGAWQLHVERQAYDVLLAKLPWSLQVVRLPWMEAPLFVDW